MRALHLVLLVLSGIIFGKYFALLARFFHKSSLESLHSNGGGGSSSSNADSLQTIVPVYETREQNNKTAFSSRQRKMVMLELNSTSLKREEFYVCICVILKAEGLLRFVMA